MKTPELGARSWREAFVAVSVLLGEPLDGALDAAGVPRASELVERLRSPSRDVRARALADGLTPVVLGIAEMLLA